MEDIKDFHIGTAFYILENTKGSKLKLVLNYAENTYSYNVITNFGKIERLKKQAETAAKNMLAKKAQKNLVDRLLELKLK